MSRHSDGTSRGHLDEDAPGASWVGLLSRDELARVDLVAQRWAGGEFSAERLHAIVEAALDDAVVSFTGDGNAFIVHALTVLRRHLKQIERG